MTPKAKLLSVIVLVAAVAGWMLREDWFLRRDQGTSARSAEVLPSVPPSDSTGMTALVPHTIEALARDLSKAASPDSQRALLFNALLRWRSEPDARSVATAIADFLRTGRDLRLAMKAKIGKDGHLTAWPSLRLFLLDVVDNFDRAIALDAARTVLGRFDSPDEMALSLRTVSWHGAVDRKDPEVSREMNRYLRQETWLRAPSDLYLEGFDIAVHNRDAAALPALVQVFAGGYSPAAARAAVIAIDRFAEVAAFALVEHMAPAAQFAPDLAHVRTAIYGRLDITWPEQYEALLRFLGDIQVADSEKARWADEFPTARQSGAYFLAEKIPALTRREFAERDYAMLRVLDEKVSRARGAAQPWLLTAQLRLRQSVAIAQGSHLVP